MSENRHATPSRMTRPGMATTGGTENTGGGGGGGAKKMSIVRGVDE